MRALRPENWALDQEISGFHLKISSEIWGWALNKSNDGDGSVKKKPLRNKYLTLRLTNTRIVHCMVSRMQQKTPQRPKVANQNLYTFT